MLTKKELTFKKGLYDALPIALGYFSVSLAFGMIAVTARGLKIWAPILTSFTNFTGTGQFVGIDMIWGMKSFYEIALTLFVINARYILMSLSLSQRLEKKITMWQRLIIAFGNTDEVFAVAMSDGQKLNYKYMLGLILGSFAGWMSGTIAGSVLGDFMPQSFVSAMGIMLYAMFIAIVVPPAKQNIAVVITIFISAVMSCIFKYVPVINKTSGGFAVIICGVFSAVLASILFPIKAGEDSE